MFKINFRTLVQCTLLLTLVACGANFQNPHTGNYDDELIVGSLSTKEEAVEGQSFFVSTTNLNVRSQDFIGDNEVGQLHLNDEVKIVDSSAQVNGQFVQIEVVKSSSTLKDSDKYFVSYKYLNEKKAVYERSKAKFYIVQNLATERLRVYERVCMDNSCPNKMIFETEMVVGEETDEGREMTAVGSYQIMTWQKFYQDGRARYPRWYDSRYPAPPKPGSGALKWTRKKYMPNGKGEMRGAFGWYTAIVGYKNGSRIKRDPNSQWTHGTIGWGEDKNKFIKKTKGFWANVFANPRSHGCSRVNNEAIAYLREILPVGTPLIKIYAKESYANASLSRYNSKEKQWDYILTKEKKGKSSATEVNKRNVSNDKILERGTATIDLVPTLMKYTPGEELRTGERKRNETGNVYGVLSYNMHGVFYIDTGIVEDYKHPTDKRVKVGGLRSEIVPSFMNANEN